MKTAIVALQGMGKPNIPLYNNLEKRLRKKLTAKANEAIKFFPVNYQAAFQKEQDLLWNRTYEMFRGKLRQRNIRKFLLNYFSDAVTYESDKEAPHGV